jgi:O-antigen/teichoic acid export membrane protein
MMVADSLVKTVQHFIGSADSLRRRLIIGGMWVILARAGAAAAEFLRSVVFVRFLLPDDFGLMGVAVLFLAGLNVVSETGLNVLVVQRPGDISQYLDTAWTIKFLRGWLLATVVFVGAPVVAHFYQDERLILLLRVVSLSFIIGGLDNFGHQLLNRELEFKKPAMFGLAANLANVMIGVVLVVVLRNVWALIGFQLVSTASSVASAYLVSRYRPRFAFDRAVATEAFRFGRHVFLSNILIYLATQGDDAFVGKYLGLGVLGYYTRAYFLSNTPATQITQLVSSVSLPGYSRLQEDRVRLRSAYVKTLKLIFVTAVPVGVGLLVFAHPLVLILFGERWLPIVPAMRILCLFGILRAIVGVNGSLLLAIGRPDAVAIIGFIQVAVLAALIYPLARSFGLVGVCWAVVLCALANLAANIYFISKSKVGSVGLWEK